MSIIQAIVLGIIQGITEFLPVSSSGHLIFLPKLFGWADQGVTFDVIVHLGTLVAVVWYFRKKLWNIFLAVTHLNKKEKTQNPKFEIQNYRKLGWLILLGTIPAGLVAVLFGDIVEEKLRTPFVIGVSFIVWGIILGLADNIGRLKDWKIKHIEEIHWRNVLFIGCAQAVALIPGTSRSGITMTAGLFSKLTKESAAEFSFLLSVPIIALAGLSGIRDMLGQTAEHIGLFPMFCGFIASMISGLFAIGILMKIIKRWNFTPFVLYRIIVGLLILFFL